MFQEQTQCTVSVTPCKIIEMDIELLTTACYQILQMHVHAEVATW